MSKTVLIDTNLLLDDPKIIYKLTKEYEKILIPITVLKELDKHKYNPNLSYSARNAIQSIREFKSLYPNKIAFHVYGHNIDSNDSRIIEAAKQYTADIATKDISMSIIAEAENLKTKIYDVVLNNIFNPYIHIRVEDIYKYCETFAWQQKYIDSEYNKIISLFEKVSNKELIKDSWFFIMIQAEREKPFVYANNPLKYEFVRIDNEKKYLTIKTTGRPVKALDIYQNCAMFALKEAKNVLITGRWGSGKTLLATAHSIESSSKKVFITRPPIGINSKYEIGFFPGGKEEKMMDWLSGFTSSLYYIYGNTKGQTNNNYGEYNYVMDVLFPQVFEVLPLNSIQGLSLLENDSLMVDEIQLLSVDYMSMLLSRPSESGRLILMGDLAQTYSVVKPSESGLLKLLRVLPHRALAYVELKNSYRSELLEVADKLQDKTIG